jgi:hypothetical protein
MIEFLSALDEAVQTHISVVVCCEITMRDWA